MQNDDCEIMILSIAVPLHRITICDIITVFTAQYFIATRTHIHDGCRMKPKRNELDELHALGDAKFGRPKGVPAPSSYGPRGARNYEETLDRGSAKGPSLRSAAMGHRANDMYMERWEEAYAELEAGNGPPNLSQLSRGATFDIAPSRGQTSSTRRALSRGSTRASAGPQLKALSPSAAPLRDRESIEATNQIGRRWYQGPRDPAGRLLDLSDRPIMSVSLNPATGEVCLGCSDHAAYCVDLTTGRVSRTLYSKQFGHREWVTSVAYLGDYSGRVATAAMDGKVCLWDAGRRGGVVPCTDLVGHFGSVSQVHSPGISSKGEMGSGPSRFGHFLFSAGYDKSIRVWDTSTGGTCTSVLKGHSAPVLEIDTYTGPGGNGPLRLGSGDRDGVCMFWDVESGKEYKLAGHKGHITALRWVPPAPTHWTSSTFDGTAPSERGRDDPPSAEAGVDLEDMDAFGNPVSPPPSSASAGGCTAPLSGLLLSGAQDGCLRVWDTRAKSCVQTMGCHVTTEGTGAIGDISIAYTPPTTTQGSETLLVTAGADRSICVVDPRRWRARHVIQDHRDFIYSMQVVGGRMILSGGGDGLLLAHDLATGKLVWGLGANVAAVRCVSVWNNRMMAAGDDGKALIYDMA